MLLGLIIAVIIVIIIVYLWKEMSPVEQFTPSFDDYKWNQKVIQQEITKNNMVINTFRNLYDSTNNTLNKYKSGKNIDITTFNSFRFMLDDYKKRIDKFEAEHAALNRLQEDYADRLADEANRNVLTAGRGIFFGNSYEPSHF